MSKTMFGLMFAPKISLSSADTGRGSMNASWPAISMSAITLVMDALIARSGRTSPGRRSCAVRFSGLFPSR